jgi:phasin family protein
MVRRPWNRSLHVWSESMNAKPKLVEAANEITGLTPPSYDKAIQTLKQTAATATASLEQAQAKMKEGYTTTMKTAEEFTKFQQGNLEAVIKSSQILATGLTDISKNVAATAQANLEETMANFRALTSVKSLKEAFDLQAGFARTALEKAMSESGKLTETSLKLVEQASAPLTARLNAAVETFSTRA